jgi:hypothetical protein
MLDEQLCSTLPSAGFRKLHNASKPANGSIPASVGGNPRIDKFLVKLVPGALAILTCRIVLPP